MYSLEWFSKVILASIVSWIGGLIVFFLTLLILNGQLPQRGDVIAEIGLSFLTSALFLPTVHLPSLLILRRILGGCKPIFIFCLIGSLAGLVCTTFVIWMFSTTLAHVARALFSSIGLFWAVLFLTEGLIFAVGFVWSSRE